MLFFRSEDTIDTWCSATGMPRGAALPVELVWTLSLAWYSSRLDPEYRGRSAAEAEAIFRSLGLSPPFWSLEGNA